MPHILVTLELKVPTSLVAYAGTAKDIAEFMSKQYENGSVDADDLLRNATSVTPTFEGME